VCQGILSIPREKKTILSSRITSCLQQTQSASAIRRIHRISLGKIGGLAELEERPKSDVMRRHIRPPTDGATGTSKIRNIPQHSRFEGLDFVRPASAFIHVVRESGHPSGISSRPRTKRSPSAPNPSSPKRKYPRRCIPTKKCPYDRRARWKIAGHHYLVENIVNFNPCSAPPTDARILSLALEGQQPTIQRGTDEFARACPMCLTPPSFSETGGRKRGHRPRRGRLHSRKRLHSLLTRRPPHASLLLPIASRPRFPFCVSS
jgi:hypothetical protein